MESGKVFFVLVLSQDSSLCTNVLFTITPQHALFLFLAWSQILFWECKQDQPGVGIRGVNVIKTEKEEKSKGERKNGRERGRRGDLRVGWTWIDGSGGEEGGGTTELSLARDTAAAPMGKYLLPTGWWWECDENFNTNCWCGHKSKWKKKKREEDGVGFFPVVTTKFRVEKYAFNFFHWPELHFISLLHSDWASINLFVSPLIHSDNYVCNARGAAKFEFEADGSGRRRGGGRFQKLESSSPCRVWVPFVILWRERERGKKGD